MAVFFLTKVREKVTAREYLVYYSFLNSERTGKALLLKSNIA